MSNKQLQGDEFEHLLVDLLDNKLAQHDFDALIAALRESEELRRRACRFLGDEVLLADEIGATHKASKIVDALSLRFQEIASRTQSGSVFYQKSRFSLVGLINRNGLVIAAAAALVIVGLCAHNMIMMSKLSRLHSLVVQGAGQGEVEVVVASENEGSLAQNDGENGPSAQEHPVVLGRVIGLSEAQMYENDLALTFGDLLKEGQRIRLASGVMELLLSTGAKLTVEGPVDLELNSLLKMDLEMGKVVAAVPRTARGYTIMTPTSELVDIGTQFGVSVDDSGDTELHVFDGDVVARSRIAEMATDLVHAKENEAIRFDTISTKPQRFSAREADFVRRLGPVISASQLPAIPRTDNLSLWYSADVIPTANEGDVIKVWRDILVGDNQYANDARQFDAARCPTLATDNQGRPALRFNGWSTSLVVDPLDYTDSYTIFVVCTPGPTSFAEDFHGGIVFKYGELPSLELSVLNNKQVRGWVWPGPEQSNVGSVVSEAQISDAQISVIAYKYNSSESLAKLWVNGKLQGENNAPVELRQTARAFLGGHNKPHINANFFGNLYEVVVYDEYLDDASMAQLGTYLLDRYESDPLP